MLPDLATPLTIDDLPELVSNLDSNAINKFERKIVEYPFWMKILFILTKSQKSLEDSVVLIYGVTGTVKHEIKKQEDRFLGVLLAPLAASLVQPVISSIVKTISGRGVTRARRRYWDKNF